MTRALDWMLDLQDRPGAFHYGCDRIRHARRLCQHYIAGFFAPAPPTQRLAPVTLPIGKVYRVEVAARFAISCLALRAALRAGYQDRFFSLEEGVDDYVRNYLSKNKYF